MQEPPSILIAAAFLGLLMVIRVKVFQFRAAASRGKFFFSTSLLQMLRVLSSLIVPGLGQAMRGSTSAAFWHLGVFIAAFYCIGEAAFFINLISALEHTLT